MEEGRRFVAIDVETTGVDPGVDVVTEVAVVALEDGAAWSSVIRPLVSVRVSPQHERAPEFGAVAAEFLTWLTGEGVVVASHNVAFDLRFLKQAAQASGSRLPVMSTVDTREAAWRLLGEEGTLEELCSSVGVAHDGGHTALSDATATADLLAHLLRVADEQGLGLDWLPIQHRDGPALDRCGLPPVSAQPLQRDLELWPPSTRTRRTSPQLVFEITTEDLPSVDVGRVRAALAEVVGDTDLPPEKRQDLARLLALPDRDLLAEVNRRLESRRPSDDEVLQDRVWKASAGGGLVQVRALEEIIDDVRGTRFEAGVVLDLFRARMAFQGLEGQVAAVREYCSEPTSEPLVAAETAASLLVDLVGSVRLDLADQVIAVCPGVWETRNSGGTLALQLEPIAHRFVTRDRPDDAVRVAIWASQLDLDTETSARLRGLYGSVLERAGRKEEAPRVLLDDWDGGVRSPIHADRISLLASRSGDKDTARRVLAEALEIRSLSDSDREVFSKRLARLK